MVGLVALKVRSALSLGPGLDIGPGGSKVLLPKRGIAEYAAHLEESEKIALLAKKGRHALSEGRSRVDVWPDVDYTWRLSPRKEVPRLRGCGGSFGISTSSGGADAWPLRQRSRERRATAPRRVCVCPPLCVLSRRG